MPLTHVVYKFGPRTPSPSGPPRQERRTFFTMQTTTTDIKNDTRSRTYTLAVTAVMTAVLCITAPFSIPVGPVPVSLATLIIMLTVYILGWKCGTVSILIYLLLGAVGLPVFSGFSGGFVKLAGPTGGYLVGYVLLALIAGLFFRLGHTFPKLIITRLIQAAGMLLGTAALYALGTAWFCIVTDSALAYALSLCVLPFIPGDLIKIIIVLLLGDTIKKRLRQI